MRSSRIKGFYKLNRGERIDTLRNFSSLPIDQTRALTQDGALSFQTTNLFVENAVGTYPLPLGIATSFKINGLDYLVPMAVEESSVIAAASNAAKCIYQTGGFTAEAVSSQMIGQIQLLDLNTEDFVKVENNLYRHQEKIIASANEVHPRLLMRGGGVRGIEIRSFPEAEIPFMVLHILIDTKDAMGANLVNTVCEKMAPLIEDITGARVGLKILSNLADRRVFKAHCKIHPESLRTPDIPPEIENTTLAKRLVEAYLFADTDPYRAATHNKGIMNGVDPVVIATGNDWRAIEAGAHAYAAQTGRYRSLSQWSLDEDGFLNGSLEIPLQLGTVGGVTRLHPTARIGLQILGNPASEELGKIIACSGLASNFAALRALCTSGIQKGHMKLHAKNLAFAAGAKGTEVEEVAKILVAEKDVSATAAEIILSKIRNQKESIGQKPSVMGAQDIRPSENKFSPDPRTEV